MKRIILSIILLIFINSIFVGIINAELADSPWPKFRENLKNTGLSPFNTSQANGSVMWIFASSNGMESSPAIGEDGTIYVGSHENILYAINPNGTEKWNFQVGTGPVFKESGTSEYSAAKGILSSPAIASDGTIYFTSFTNELIALSSKGIKKWSFSLSVNPDVWSSPAIGEDGTIYVGSAHTESSNGEWIGGKLYAINQDGSEKWNFQTEGDVASSPAIGEDGTIYIATGDHHLYAINPNGKQKWAFEFEDFADSSPAIGEDGTIYVGSTKEGKLYAITSNGEEEWNVKLGSSNDVWSSPAIGEDRTIYIGADDKKLYAVDSNGKIKWTFDLPNDGGASPAISADGTIYMSAKNETGPELFAINPDGTEKWSVKTGSAASSPVIGADNTIYLGTWNGLYAIGAYGNIEEEAPGVDYIYTTGPCEYNNIKTKISTPYYEEGIKIEYKDEEFVALVDPKAITNLEQLKGLECLEYADFYNQGISGDLEQLKDLVNLKVLSLHTNPEVYGDVCVFNNAPKLKSLKLAFDEQVYGDISCLKDLNLETFAMTYTQISGDLSDLSHMTNLKALYLGFTNITGNISALSGLTNLEELTLVDPAGDGSGFYGDLSSLDNLKKLKKVALYNMNVTNCEHFHEVHPNIEGGCSASSASTLFDPNTESEEIIGEGQQDNEMEDNGPKDDGGPPEACFVNNQFIGEENCRALMDKNSGKQPKEECTVNGTFIEECGIPTNGIPLTQEKFELKEIPIGKSFLQKLLNWLISLFS